MQEDRLWSKDFIVVSSVNFMLTLVFYLLVVIMGFYAVDVFYASKSEAGLVTGIFIVGTLLGRLFIGGRIERIGRKKTLLIGFAWFIVAIGLYFIQLNIGMLLVTRFLHGIGFGLTSTAAATIVTYVIPNSRKGEGIGYFSMSSTLATAIGPLIGLILTKFTTFNVIFIVCLVIAIAGFIISLTVKINETTMIKHVQPANRKFSLSNYVEPKVLSVGLITILFALCFSSVLSFMNLYAIEKNLLDAASLFFLLYAVAILISRPFTGRLFDLKGAHFVMIPAFILFAVGMVLLSIANSTLVFLIAAVLIGFGFGNLQSCSQAIAVKLVPIERMGMATATFFIFFDAGLGFGPYLLGFLLNVFSYSNMYLLLAGGVLVTMGVYWLVMRNKRPIALDE